MTDPAIGQTQHAMQSVPDLLTVEQAAHFLNCSMLTVERKLRGAQLPGIKYGRSWMIPKAALLTVINEEALAAAMTMLEQRRRANHQQAPATSPGPATPMATHQEEPRGHPGRPRLPRTPTSVPPPPLPFSIKRKKAPPKP
jgi:excisionase family DNA binding protein